MRYKCIHVVRVYVPGIRILRRLQRWPRSSKAPEDTAGNPNPRKGSPPTASSTHAWLLSFSAHVQHEARLSDVTSAPGCSMGATLGDVLAMEPQEGEDRGQWGSRGWDTKADSREGGSVRPRPAGLDRFKPARVGDVAQR